MENAKDLAKDMLSSLGLENQGLLVAYVKGLVSFPVNLYYLSYDFIHTDDRGRNMDDNMRLAKLLHRATTEKNINFIAKAIDVFIRDFMNHVNIEEVLKQTAENNLASALGDYTFGELTGVKMARLITSKIVFSIAFSMSINVLLMIGGGASRAIHESRLLALRNYIMYINLKQLGDLDLLYFVIKDRVNLFEKAVKLAKDNPLLFNKVAEYFFKGL